MKRSEEGSNRRGRLRRLRLYVSAGLAAAPPRHRALGDSVLSLWLPVVIWAAVIFGLSSIPSLGTGLGTWDTVLRKLAHTAEYAILGLLLLRATGRAWLAVAAGVLYAASDELHQHFVRGRHGSPVDVAIDAAGVLIGVFLVRRVPAIR